MRERRPNSRLRVLLARMTAVAVIALLPIAFTSATHEANAATAASAWQHESTATPSILGTCTFDPPTPIVYTFFQGGISSCGNCLDIGQLGEDEGLWENFLCWWSGADWQLWIENGPQ